MARRPFLTKFSFALSYTKLVRSKYFQRINGRRVTCTKQADLKAVCPEYSMIDLRAFPLKIWDLQPTEPDSARGGASLVLLRFAAITTMN